MQPKLTIYLDENHCENKRVLAVLASQDVVTERHLQHFTAGTPDTDWLPFVGKNGWALVTSDKAIRKRALERLAVQRYRVKMFCFTSNQMSGAQMAFAIVAALPKMRRLFERQPPPFIATISPSGSVQLYNTFGEPEADLN